MKIQQITIHNFRSIIHQSFRLEDFSLLVGENNAGKSNVIRAILAFYGKEKFEYEHDFPKIKTKDQDSWIEISFSITAAEQASLKEEYKRKDMLLVIRKFFCKENDEVSQTNSNAYFVKEDGTLSSDQFYGAKGVSEGKLGQIIFIPSVSKIDETFKMTGPSPFRDTVYFVMSDIVKKGQSFIALRSAFGAFRGTIKAEKNSENVSLTDLTDKINREISSWPGIEFDLDVGDITADLVVKNLITQKLIDQSCGKEVDSRNFGQGFQRTLIASLIKIDAEIKASTKKLSKQSAKKEFSPDFTLILFEEPEAFLHFTQEERLNADLRRISQELDKQVLVTTHSPYFSGKNTEDISNIIKLKKNQETIISQVDASFLSKTLWRQTTEIANILREQPSLDVEDEAMRFFIWLDSERASMFFAKKVLICEGATEKVFLDYLLTNAWHDIDRNGLYILDAMGKFNIYRFMTLCGLLQIDHFVLFDLDSSRKSHSHWNAFIQRQCNTFTKKIDSFTDDIETFLGVPPLPSNRANLKPIVLLKKYKEGLIDPNMMSDLKQKIVRLLS